MLKRKRKGESFSLAANYGNGLGNTGFIGEYTTTGATVNASLVPALASPISLAISQVPEPSTFSLAAVGAAALSLRRRLVAQVSKPAVSPISKSAGRATLCARWIENLRCPSTALESPSRVYKSAHCTTSYDQQV